MEYSCRPPPPRAISSADFEALIKSDVELYPTDNPLSSSVLSKWFEFHPEFGMMYDSFGCCVFVPLIPSTWAKYIRKEIEEADLIDGIFNAKTSDTGEICLHLYHIEKTENWSREYGRMAKIVLEDCKKIIESINATSKHPIRVAGCSALAASEAGYRMSRDIFQMTQLYESEEFVYRHRKDNHVGIFQRGSLVVDDEWIKIGEVRLMATHSPTVFEYQ